MKKILKYGLSGIAMLALAVSCKDTLDTHPTESFDAETVWNDKGSVEGFINRTYESVLALGYGGSGASVGWTSRTPDGIQCSQVSAGELEYFTRETSTPSHTPSNFGLLRRSNLILENVAASKMDDATKTELMAAGYLCRGLVFLHSTRLIGRFVPIMQVLTTEDEEAANVPMTKGPAESYAIVIDDLQKAAVGLPENSLPGLPNKYAAEVLLSRAALQAYAYTKDGKYLDIAIKAASDVTENKSLTSNYGNLFNENGNTDPEILWAYYRLSTNTNMGGYDELMRTYPNISIDNMRNSKSPIQYTVNYQVFECWAIHFPTQDMVDQYLVIDQESGKALPWWETSQYLENVEEISTEGIQVGDVDQYSCENGWERRIPSPADMNQVNEAYPHFTRWARLKSTAPAGMDISDIINQNRDKRYDGTIIHDKSVWCGETVETMLSGNFSQGVRDQEDGGWYNTTSGYYWRKGIAEPKERAYFANPLTAHFVVARVGEAYMNLAEAQLLKGNVKEAVAALNATRMKHGGLPASEATTADEAWADYIRERRVEMANECGDIYYSYLRWGKYGGAANHGRPAGDVIYDLDRPVYKMQMSRDRSQLLIGQHTLQGTANRRFTTRRYLWAIGQSFLDVREAYGLDHDQNEGW